MSEMVLDTNTLPESLFRLIRTAKVKARETNGEIRLTPVKEADGDCPLLGMFADGRILTAQFIVEKQGEKGLES